MKAKVKNKPKSIDIAQQKHYSIGDIRGTHLFSAKVNQQFVSDGQTVFGLE